MKKLAWSMNCSFKLSAAGRKKDEYDDVISKHTQKGCVMCKKSSTLLGDIKRDAHKCKCRICWQYVCSSCKIKKKRSHINTLTGKLTEREFPFCSACVFKVVTASSFVITQQEIAAAATIANGSELFRSLDSELFSTSSSDVSDRS